MRRFLVILVVSVFLLSGCVIVERKKTTPSPPTEGTPGAAGEEAPQADPAALSPSSDRRLVGSLGWALLSPDVPGAVVEIDQLGGATVGQGAIDALEHAMRDHGGKEDVHVVVEEAAKTRDVYSLENLVSSAEEHRSRSSGDGTVALHVLVLPGRFQAEGVPGVAFHATTIALFPEEIGRLLPPGAAVGAFEAAVATHELGHTFGLVNRTGVGEFHEDPQHPGTRRTRTPSCTGRSRARRWVSSRAPGHQAASTRPTAERWRASADNARELTLPRLRTQ